MKNDFHSRVVEREKRSFTGISEIETARSSSHFLGIRYKNGRIFLLNSSETHCFSFYNSRSWKLFSVAKANDKVRKHEVKC